MTKEQKAKESVQKYFLCNSEKYGCREKEYCQFCGGENTAHDCDEDCQADIYNEGFYAGWDEALKSQFRKCVNNKPVEGEEPKDGENVILLCQIVGGSNDGYIFPKANTFKNGEWEGRMLMRYNVIAWMPIPSFDNILKEK